MRCGDCEHLLPFGEWNCSKRKKPAEDCPDFLDREAYRSRNSGNEPKEIIYLDDYDYSNEEVVKVPCCPECREYVGSEDECPFCGQKLLNGYDPGNVEISFSFEGKDGKAVEVGSNHHIWIHWDGKEYHLQNGERHTERELIAFCRKFLKAFEEIAKKG